MTTLTVSDDKSLTIVSDDKNEVMDAFDEAGASVLYEQWFQTPVDSHRLVTLTVGPEWAARALEALEGRFPSEVNEATTLTSGAQT